MKGYRLILILIVVSSISCTRKAVINKGEDTWVRDVEKRKDDFSKSEILTAYTWTHYGSGETKPAINGRILLRFDMGDLPIKAKIKSAKLSLYFAPDIFYLSGQATENNKAMIRGISNDWKADDANWNNQPTADTLEQVPIMYPDKKKPTTEKDLEDIDVTKLLKKMWKDRSKKVYKNFGFQIILEEESDPYKDLCFASFDNKNIDKRPKLLVVYKK